jgi:ribose 5-phosphate isomerase B
MKIAIASDHAGYEEKENIKKTLDEIGVEYLDLGTNSPDSVDYPNFGKAVGEAVASGKVEQGIVVCGSGIGISIAANKVNGIRAALAHNAETATLARQHNDANILAIGARTTEKGTIPNIVKAWFNAKFEGGRHQNRIDIISDIEKQNC